jgi:hypothetical protein
MRFDFSEPAVTKPLAGTCQHRWQKLESPFYQAQVCENCKLYRYKAGQSADWEYRAPIPRALVEKE